MAEDRLTSAIVLLREENNKKLAELNENQEKTASATTETARLIGDMLEGMALDRQRNQDKKEGTPQPKGGSGGKGPAGKEEDDEGGGILLGLGRILAGIAGAVLGFATGIVQGFALAFAKIMKFLKLDVVFRPLTNAVKSFIRTIKTIPAFFKNMGRSFTAGFKGLKTINSAITGAFVSTSKGLSGINKFFFNLGEGLKKLSVSKIGLAIQRQKNKFIRFIKPLGDFFKSIGSGFGKVSGFFRSIGDGIKKAGKIFSGMGKAFKTLFSIFRGFGRFIAFPITIAMAVWDGITGFFAGFKQYKEKGFIGRIFGGVMGAIKKVFSNLVMLPLDLVKKGIGWISGKLGFENFQNMLAGFSFQGLFEKFVDGFTNMIFGAGEWFKEKLSGATEWFAGLGESVKAFNQRINDGINQFFNNVIDAIFEKFANAKDMFSNLGDALGNVKDKFKQFIISKLPDQESFLAKFVPDAVYEWANSPPPPPVEAQPPAEGSEGSESQMDVAAEDVDSKRIRALEKRLENFDDDFEREKEVYRFTQEDIDGADSEEDRQDMLASNRDLDSGDFKIQLREQLEKGLELEKQEELKSRQLRAERQAKIEAMGGIDAFKQSKMDERVARMSDERREKNLAKAREMILRSERGEEVLEVNKRRAEMILQAEQNRQASMVVAPQTSVVNNNSSQGIVMNQNMPSVDPLDMAYGV